MSRSRRSNGPADPAAILRRRTIQRALDDARAAPADGGPETWGLDPTGLALAANANVATRADLAGRIVRARRQDVFDRLNARGRLGAEALNAVRRLQSDIAALHRAPSGVGRYGPRVDRSIGAGDLAETRLRAGERIEAALALTGPASARLLLALCEADLVAGRTDDWRAVVRRETGETLPDAQGALVRMACENLAGAYAGLRRGRAA